MAKRETWRYEFWLIDMIVEILTGIQAGPIRRWVEGSERCWPQKPDLVFVLDRVIEKIGAIDRTTASSQELIEVLWERITNWEAFGYSQESMQELSEKLRQLGLTGQSSEGCLV